MHNSPTQDWIFYISGIHISRVHLSVYSCHKKRLLESLSGPLIPYTLTCMYVQDSIETDIILFLKYLWLSTKKHLIKAGLPCAQFDKVLMLKSTNCDDKILIVIEIFINFNYAVDI